MDFPALVGTAFGGLYLWRTGVEPLRRAGLEVVLEPEGIRVGGRFYRQSAFYGLRRASGWWARRAWEGLGYLHGYLPMAPHPPFHLDFGGSAVPLHLDLPGWDRLLRHLGLDWREAPAFQDYLCSVRGMGWPNGPLYPPKEVEPAWLEARSRYRWACAWIWAGVLGMLGGLVGAWVAGDHLGEDSPLAWVSLGVFFGGLLLGMRWYADAFRLRGFGRGWASRYNPWDSP